MNELNFNPFPVLKTDRVILRKLDMSDSELIFNYQSDKENFKFVDMPIYTNIKQAKNYITKMNNGVEDNKWIIWAIADAYTNKILGTISIWNISTKESKGELGYGLFPGNKGIGIMSEALKKVVEFGLDVMKLERIEAYTNKVNIKSIQLLERNNFTKKSDFTETETSDEIPIEMVIYEYKKDK